MSRLAAIITAPVLIAVVYFGFLYLIQRSVLFPTHLIPGAPRTPDLEIVRLSLPSGVVEALYLPPLSEDGRSPLMIFTHGNAELADFWIDAFDEPRGWGWGALLVEYPGYGRSAGSPSEASIRDTVLAAYDWAAADPRVDPTRIVAYGRSLGGCAAALLAAERSVAALILESTFTSVRAFARRYLAPGFLVRDPFDALDALGRYSGPLLVLHGRDDGIVPIEHGRALADRVEGAVFHEMRCGHNDCPRSWDTISAWLEDSGLKRP